MLVNASPIRWFPGRPDASDEARALAAPQEPQKRGARSVGCSIPAMTCLRAGAHLFVAPAFDMLLAACQSRRDNAEAGKA